LLLAPLYAFLISLFDFQFCRQIPWKNRKSSVLFLRFEKTKLNIISLQKIKKPFKGGKMGFFMQKTPTYRMRTLMASFRCSQRARPLTAKDTFFDKYFHNKKFCLHCW
jgi:hypothetical protein